jgi:twitching motility protein PilT
LREDPDVILVGEMRDIETISFAISAAETGHLVFGTVHTTSADTSVDRIINAFPHGQQPQVRTILASSLRSVICQYLVPRKDGRGRVPAVEVMINSDAISNLIRKGKTYQIANVVATSRELGMQSMDNDLSRLYRAGVITSEEGYMRAVNKKEFEAVVIENESGTSKSAQLLTGDNARVEGGEVG